MKQWYKITCYAKLDDEGLRAMNKYFCESMHDSMGISQCSLGEIVLDDVQDDPDEEEEDEDT